MSDPVAPQAARPPSEEQLCARAVQLAGIVDASITVGATDQFARLRAAAGTVVVVGEAKQGKSSLVNALVGEAGLSPVDVTVATTTYVTLRHAPPPGAQVVVDGERAAEVTPSEAAEHVRGRVSGPVDRVDLRVDAPWLDGMVLVDTPGVGGLSTAHTEIAAAAAADAAVLVVVTSAASPLSARELAFLQRVADVVETVVLVLTKIRKFTDREWEAVLEQNRTELADAVPRFATAPWFAVDAVAALDAVGVAAEHPHQSPGTTPDADGLWEESRLGPLLAHLRQTVVGREGALASVNVLRAACSLVERALAVLDEDIRMADPAELEAAAARKEACDRERKKINDERRMWGPTLEKHLGLVRNDALDHVTTQIAEMQRKWAERFDRQRRYPSENIRTGWLDELDVDATRIAEATLVELVSRLAAAADALLAARGRAGSVDRGPTRPDIPERLVERRTRYTAQQQLVFFFRSTSFGRAAGAFAVSAGIAPWMLPISVTVGAVGLGASLWIQRESLKKRDLSQATTSWIGLVERRLKRRVENDVIDARHAMHESFHEASAQREAELERTTKQLEKSVKERQQNAQQARRRRPELVDLRTALEWRLANVRPSGHQPPSS